MPCLYRRAAADSWQPQPVPCDEPQHAGFAAGSQQRDCDCASQQATLAAVSPACSGVCVERSDLMMSVIVVS